MLNIPTLLLSKTVVVSGRTNMWDPALYERSIRFAAEWHGNQQMSTSQPPYVVHLAQVAHRVLWGLQCDGQPAEVINVALQVALLHDVLEDTACTREHLVATFGETVTAAVDALSKRSRPQASGVTEIRRATSRGWRRQQCGTSS